MGPPEKEEPGATPDTGPVQKKSAEASSTTNQANTTSRQGRLCAADTVSQLRSRRQASRRLPRHCDRCSASDPLLCRCWEPEPPLSENALDAWRAAIKHTLPIGTPVVPIEVLQRLHRNGGADRELAECVWAPTDGLIT